MERVRQGLRKVITYISRPEMRVLPGQLAFFFVVSLIPLIAMIGTIAGYFSVSADKVEQILESILPFELKDNFITFISGKVMTFNISFFFISAFVLASNGCHSMIITSNHMYEIKSKSFFYRRIKAIGMTFILVLLLFFLLIVPVFGDAIFNIVTSSINNVSKVNFARGLYRILQYPLSIVLVFFSIKLLYTLAPDRKIKSKTTYTGSIFTTVGWILATKLYAIYAGTFSNYNLFYGSISDILFLLMWFYILSYIFVLGMAFNATNTKKDDFETMQLTLKK